MKKLPASQKVEYFELLFVRLLHTLGHHPDFSTGHEDLLDLARYVVESLGLCKVEH
jgi:sister-chromatid-cohesion protein PDS5